MRFHHLFSAAVAGLLIAGCAGLQPGVSPEAKAAPAPLRLYVLDCGTLHLADTKPFGLSREEVGTSDLSVACVLVTHAKGSLIWDTGAVPDTEWRAIGTPVRHVVDLPGAGQRQLTLRKPLAGQLAEIGYAPREHLSALPLHFDHPANANAFATATCHTRGGA